MSAVTVTVLSNGQAVDPAFALRSVDIRRELNRVPSAMLTYADGDAASQTFPVSDSGLFNPGSEVQIKARYEGQPNSERVLFRGLVVRHAIEADRRGSHLRIELRDAAVKLTAPRRSAVFEQLADSDVISQLAAGAGLAARVSNTHFKHPTLVQYDCSDWDFLLARAEANGLLLAVTDGALSLAAPPTGGQAEVRIHYGIDTIFTLEFETDALGQNGAVQTQGWDIQHQATLRATGKPPAKPGQGQLSSAAAAKKLGYADTTLVHPVGAAQEELKAWADAQGQRASLSLVRGRACLAGDGTLALLQVAQIDGVARCFNGKALITGLCHRIDASGWQTDLQFGLNPRQAQALPGINSPAAAGLLPAMAGLHIGIVQTVVDDPGGQYRVKVTLPGLPDTAQGLWARQALPDAGNKRGWVFRPEPGDEVVLGFFNQDPRQPVILGALYSSQQLPPADILDDSSKNTLKGLVSRAGLTIALVDADKPKLFLQTPAKRKLLLDDDGQAITLSDGNGNSLTLDANGITLDSAKGFKVTAKGAVEITGQRIDLN